MARTTKDPSEEKEEKKLKDAPKPSAMIKYKPLPHFGGGCKNC